MKKLYSLTLVLASALSAMAQNVGVGTNNPASKLDVKGNLTIGNSYSGTTAPANGAIIEGQLGVGTAAPDSKALLDLTATDKGVLLPRVALVSTTNPISGAKPDGLMVYNTSTSGTYPTPGVYVWSTTTGDWVRIITNSTLSGSLQPLSNSAGGGLGTFSYNGGTATQIGIANQGVVTGMLANDAVTTTQIAPNTITSADMGPNSVDLSSGVVTNVLPVNRGGTNTNSLGSGGSIAYSNGTSYAFSPVGSTGQVLVSGGTGQPTWSSVSSLNADLTPGTGLTGSAYDGSAAQTFGVAYGTTAGTAVQGNQTATISAGAGLTGGVAADALGDGVTATVNVGAGTGITVNADDIAVKVDGSTIDAGGAGGSIRVISLPTGNNGYIQNTTVQQAGANFNISGNGTLAGAMPLTFTSIGSGNYNKTVLYHDAAPNGFYLDLARTTDATGGTPIDFRIDARGGGANFFAIKGATGNVGIGTAAPNVRLEVNGATRTSSLQLTNANTVLTQGSGNSMRTTTSYGYTEVGPQNSGWSHFTTDRPAFWFSNPIYVNGGQFSSYNTSDLLLQTNGTTRITALASNGNVGIGVSPSARLHVSGGGMLLGTNGASSNTRTLTILEDGDAQTNFGSYPGAWTSALQIQDNTSANRFVWLSPLDAGSGANTRMVSAGSGFDLYVNGNSGSSGSLAMSVAAGTAVTLPSLSAGGLVKSSGGTLQIAGGGDLPGGSGNYIQNGTGSQSANFNITGYGYAGNYFQTPTMYVSNYRHTASTYENVYSDNNSSGGFRLLRNDGNSWGYFYADNGGIGILKDGSWAIRASGSTNGTNSDVSFYTDGGARRAYISSGGLYFDAANPYINASSYFISPGGAYFNSGTVYFEAASQHRGGIQNDGGNYNGWVRIHDDLWSAGWLRSDGGAGWYSQTYGGGWNMVDGSYVRCYGDKALTYGLGAYNTASVYGGYAYGNSTSDGHRQLPNPNAPGSTGWGYLGQNSTDWYYVYSDNYTNTSAREKKRDILPLDDAMMGYVMSDIEKIKPSFYKYKGESDEIVPGFETRYRPNMHLGVILDETPDYLQDNAFSGVDIYAMGVFALTGVKYQQKQIKELQQQVNSNMAVGTGTVTGTSVTVQLPAGFCAQGETPVINITPTSANSGFYLSAVDSKSFTVTANGSMSFNWQAVKVSAPSATVAESRSTVDPALANQLVVDPSIKDKVHDYWKKSKEQLQAEYKVYLEGVKQNSPQLYEKLLRENKSAEDFVNAHSE